MQAIHAVADLLCHAADAALRADPSLRSLALRKLLRRFVDVCNAIDYAHTRGVLHRDIKPANVILGRHGETLVVDWAWPRPWGWPHPDSPAGEHALAPLSTNGSAETLPGSAMGTPAFMSPEQAAGDLDLLGPRSDVYSLGATLYCLLTGRPPVEGGALGAVLHAVQLGDFPRPRALDRSIDRAMEATCLKAMARGPWIAMPPPGPWPTTSSAGRPTSRSRLARRPGGNAWRGGRGGTGRRRGPSPPRCW